MEGKKIKAIVKRSDEVAGHMTWISDTLENLQKHVDGHIESVTIGDDLVVLCDEEGRLKGKPHNCTLFPGQFSAIDFVGDIVVVGVDGEEFGDVPISLKLWKRIYLGLEV